MLRDDFAGQEASDVEHALPSDSDSSARTTPGLDGDVEYVVGTLFMRGFNLTKLFLRAAHPLGRVDGDFVR